MASWAAVLALSGFRYHGGEKSVVIQPRINQGKFSCFWSTGTGWGTFAHTVQRGATRVSLAVAHGEVTCRSLTITTESGTVLTSSAELGGTSVAREVPVRIQTMCIFQQTARINLASKMSG